MNSQKPEKKIIGLTGGIGSGKSLISKLFTSFGIPTYNSDNEAKKLYYIDYIKTQVIGLFGEDVYENGVLNTKALAQIVFSDKDKLAQLNKIIHPEVKRHFNNWLEHQNSKLVIKETAILIETKIYESCDYVICVSCPEELRISRVLKRDGITESQIRDRISKQITDSERNQYADWIIDNSGKKSVIKQVHNVYRSLQKS